MRKILSLASAVVLLVLFALTVWTVNYNNRERLSNRQLISIAAGREVERRVGSVRYSSPDDLINRNPVCCVVLRANHEWLRFPYEVFENDEVVVILRYVVNSGQEEEKYYVAEVAVNSVGKVLRSRGITTNVISR